MTDDDGSDSQDGNDAGSALTPGTLTRRASDRQRAAADRRSRMRARLMESALVVFGQRGVEASVIDDITAVAGVSRGTFYNYFQSNEDALRSVAIAAANEMMEAVASVVLQYDDGVRRTSAGVRSWIRLIAEHPQLAAFFRRAGLYVLEQNTRVRVDMPRDLLLGMQSGQFTITELELGFVIVGGTVLAAINSIVLGDAPEHYDEIVSERILMALGVSAEAAREVATLPLDRARLPADGMIIGAEARAAGLAVSPSEKAGSR